MAKTISLSNPEAIRRAGELIRAGKLVVFPTETVYGLGANALDAEAVARIFVAKRRPETSPLIVHVNSIEMARSLVRDWPVAASRLASRFWPGPLTLVLPKQSCVPDIVTAGLDTVGVRMPAHPVALALITAAGVPIAAPSANRFTELSPTSADHVPELEADAILDGGASPIGLESTVLSLVEPRPVLLRPGIVTREALAEVLGRVDLQQDASAGPHASPGQHLKHYSPRTPLVLVEDAAIPQQGRGAYLMLDCMREPPNVLRVILMSSNPDVYASALYATLHELDALGLDWIAVEQPPRRPEWTAIWDRLERAAHR